MPQSTEWLERVKYIDISKIKEKNNEIFDEIIDETIEMFSREEIDPYPSAIYSLADVNKAIKYIYGKKSLGKVIIDMKRKTN